MDPFQNVKWLVARQDKSSFPPVAGAVAAFICMRHALHSNNLSVSLLKEQEHVPVWF